MTTLSDKIVTLRKQCRCFGCQRIFLPGEKIRKKTVKSSCGDLGHTTWCDTCTRYWFENLKHDDEIMEGDLRSEDPEGWEAVRQKVEAAK